MVSPSADLPCDQVPCCVWHGFHIVGIPTARRGAHRFALGVAPSSHDKVVFYMGHDMASFFLVLPAKM